MPSKEKNMDKKTQEEIEVLVIRLRRGFGEGAVMRAVAEKFGLSWKETQKVLKTIPRTAKQKG
jgi:predicted 3-demethylubiquinone-9 3-methyltransferase (glyoxalase superfamily)